MKVVISLLLTLTSTVAFAYLCPADQVWIDMNCSLCGTGETCLDTGCCPNYKISPTGDLCCDYISADGKCVYHGGECPDNTIYDISTGACIVPGQCSDGLMWNGTRCCRGW